MPDYPVEIECRQCGTRIEISREEARGHDPDPESPNAIVVALQQRGWVQDEIEDAVLCPDCAGGHF